jgi:hypothetical protein
MVTQGDRGDPVTVPLEVREAFLRWARTVVGAPRGLDAQITEVVAHDEEIARLATTVVRRDLFQQRAAVPPSVGNMVRGVVASVGRMLSRDSGVPTEQPAMDARTIDPFAVSLGELRTQTEREEPCVECGGSGRVTCRSCAGSGRQRCGECGGSGQILRQYKKSSRYIQCRTCRTSGTVGCIACGRSGNVTCGSCEGRGRQLVWWAWRESGGTVVRFSADSPVLRAHPSLQEARALRPTDLRSFTVSIAVENNGLLTPQHYREDDALRAHLAPRLDPQLERVSHQQFVKFNALRRDVSYELCGAKGTVVLVGNDLVGAPTPEAVRPIHRRSIAWAAAACILVAAGAWYYAVWSGPTAWFDTVNAWLGLLVALGTVASIVAAGGFLRTLRPGFQWWPVRPLERAALVTFAVVLVLCPLIGYLGRPRAEVARAALARGDLTQARLVVEALNATRPGRDVVALLDELELHEARGLSGDARLAKLDAVTLRNGERSREARELARRHRLDEVRAAIAARQSEAALEKLNRWAGALSSDPEAQELRASALDARRVACTDDLCRFAAARDARTVRATPTRDAAFTEARGRLLRTLTAREVSPDPAVTARSLRAVSSLAAGASAFYEDSELVGAARDATTWVEAERARIKLVGAPTSVVDDILERSAGAGSATGWPELRGVAVYASTSAGRCEGFYVIGSAPGARALTGREPGVGRLLRQATGRPEATVRARPTSSRTDTVARWSEGGTPVVARWSGNALMELRIGNVNP